MIGQTIAGNLIFNEMANATMVDIYMKAMGIVLVLLGIKCLTSKHEYNKKIELEKRRQSSMTSVAELQYFEHLVAPHHGS